MSEITQTDNGLGGRIPLLKPADLSADQKKLYESLDDNLVPWAKKSGFQATTPDGALIGPFNGMLYSPLLGQGMIEYLSAERKHTSLSPRQREVVILTVGSVWKCAYELYAHTSVAEKAGLEPQTIRALAAGESPGDGLTTDERFIHQFVHELTADRRVSDETYDTVAARFGPVGVADVIHLASLYMGTCALLNGFAVPVP